MSFSRNGISGIQLVFFELKLDVVKNYGISILTVNLILIAILTIYTEELLPELHFI